MSLSEATLEKGAAAGAIASIKTHDSKRFRLRAVSHETEIYERFFHKSIAKKVSWIQIGIAAFVLIAQMTVMFILMDRTEFTSTGSFIGAGIWSSIFMVCSAVTTLWAARKPSYGKLHASMALHIISVLLQIIFICILFGCGIHELKRSIRQIHWGTYRDRYHYYYSGYIDPMDEWDVPSNKSSPTTTTPIPIKEGKDYLLHQLNLAFLLSTMMSFAGIMQTLMSFFMSLKTGRAICCGRTHLEGKFLEMEAVGREDADAVVNFRVGAKEKQTVTDVGNNGSNKLELIRPPPYCPDLFNSPTTTTSSNA